MKKSTLMIHTPFPENDAYGALSMPVYHSLAYEFDNADIMSDAFCGRLDMPDYSRVTNPTVIYYENRVKALTGATDAVAFNSGMAAINATIFGLASKGKNIVTSRHLFGNTYMLLASTLRRFGVEARFCDLTNIDDLKRHIDSGTCCVYLEIMTNPQMEVADLTAISSVAHPAGIPVVADTTMIPFTEFSSHSLGVDIEVVSSSKYISGGATSLGGLVIDYGTADGFGETIRREMLMNFGGYMTPHAAYMQTLGLETLEARYRIQAKNALDIATRLDNMPGVRSVNYVGLDSNPFHEIAQKQFGPTAGAMITFELGDTGACFEFLNRLRIIKRATNLFDNRSLAIHPASTIYGNFTKEERKAMDVSENLIRLSIGLEDADDITDDISRALNV